MRPPAVPLPPGSEAGPEALPREMRTFAMPELPDPAACPEAVSQLLEKVREAAAACAGPGRRRFPLSGLQPSELALLDQLLGEGEVSARVADGAPLRVQESAFAGVWRVRRQGSGEGPALELLEVGPIPGVVLEAAERGRPLPLFPGELPEGVMNGPALLEEVRQQLAAFSPGGPPHVINFTLLPMAPTDFLLLERALGVGALTLLSRGYGNCRIGATGVRRVWRVQYYNSADQLILDTLEIAEIPEAALAAPEDLSDSAQRLGELLQWLREPS